MAEEEIFFQHWKVDRRIAEAHASTYINIQLFWKSEQMAGIQTLNNSYVNPPENNVIHSIALNFM